MLFTFVLECANDDEIDVEASVDVDDDGNNACGDDSIFVANISCLVASIRFTSLLLVSAPAIPLLQSFVNDLFASICIDFVVVLAIVDDGVAMLDDLVDSIVPVSVTRGLSSFFVFAESFSSALVTRFGI